MRLYLDDDSAEALLVTLLKQAGHDVQIPADIGMIGQYDSIHLAHAVREDRALLTRNHDDFKSLHELIVEVHGHYPGLLIVRRDNDPTRDLKPAGIVRALRNLLTAGVPIRDQFHILNHWR
jgi:predicted nuclease of predicted toxin-antitoxin system